MQENTSLKKYTLSTNFWLQSSGFWKIWKCLCISGKLVTTVNVTCGIALQKHRYDSLPGDHVRAQHTAFMNTRTQVNYSQEHLPKAKTVYSLQLEKVSLLNYFHLCFIVFKVEDVDIMLLFGGICFLVQLKINLSSQFYLCADGI